MRSVVAWSQERACTKPGGAPASAKARAKCSPLSGLRGECLTITALPAASGAALHPDLTVTASYCPVTGALLGVDVHLAGTQPAHDLDLDLSPGGIADRLATRRERAHR